MHIQTTQVQFKIASGLQSACVAHATYDSLLMSFMQLQWLASHIFRTVDRAHSAVGRTALWQLERVCERLSGVISLDEAVLSIITLGLQAMRGPTFVACSRLC